MRTLISMPNVLIIDDNKDMSEMFAAVLQGVGHRTSIINHARQVVGIDLCYYDVVVIDYMVPDKLFGGVGAVVEYVRDECCHDNIIIVTSMHIEEATQFGLPVLLKPVDFDLLAEAVGELGSRRIAA